MSKKFYVSDLHLYHAGIIKHAKRPFATVGEMNDTIVRNWNATVGKNDTVYFLGDFCYREKEYADTCGKVLDSLHGNIHLIKGNHDPEWLLQHPKWKSVNSDLMVRDEEHTIHLFHYPIEDWNRKFNGSLHFFGHIHEGIITDIENRYCLCVEKIGYTPRTVKEVLEIKPK